MNEASPAPGSGRNPKITINIILAAILSLFALWVTVADFSHPGDLMFQTSASLLFAVLFAGLLFMLLSLISALPIRMILGVNCLLVMRFALGFPLNAWLGNTAAARIISVAVLALSLYYLHTSVKGRPHLATRPWMQGWHSVKAILAGVVVLVVSLPVVAFGYMNAIRNFAGDYTEFSPRGVNLVERVFQKNGQSVHLVPMMHVGDGNYYSDLNQRMHAEPETGRKRLILTEGVADRNHILPADFATGKTYERLAKLFGLKSQTKTSLGPDAPAATPPDPAALQAPPAHTHTTSNPDVTWQNADIDVSDLKDSHRELLVGLLTMMSSTDPMQMMNPQVSGMTGEQIEDLFRNGLLNSRNEVMMKRFNEMNTAYTDIYIPWGAAHLPDVEKRLLALGYQKTSEVSRPIVRFWK